MKVNSKHYVLISVGFLTLAVSISCYCYLYSVTFSQAEQYSALVQEIKDNEANNYKEVKMLNMSSSTAEKRAMLSSYYITDDQILNFIKSIENIAKESSTEIVLSAVSADELDAKDKGTTGHIKLHAEIKGNWLNVNKALALIENLPYSVSTTVAQFNAEVGDDLSVDLDKNPNKKAVPVKGVVWKLSLDVSALTIN